jgi:NAD+ synthase (glutamine-hydrolysing)
MRVAIAQMNSVLGDFSGNKSKILQEVDRAQEKHCDLVIFPEAALFGYHPFDLLERKDIVAKQLKALKEIEKKIPKNMAVIVGVISFNPNKKGRPYYNSAALLQKGKRTQLFHKQLLPTGDVFDEARFIESGKMKNNFVRINGKKILITICEDIWAWPEKDGSSAYLENPITQIKEKADLVVNLSASPYYPNKLKRRQELVSLTARHFRAPMVYVNMVGAQDEIIFDGASFAVDKKGKVILQCVKFEEDLNVLDLDKQEGGFRSQELSITDELRQALVLGIKDFCAKTGLSKIHLGLSGGIDSALVACLAVDALGPSKVTAVAMPGPFTSPKSTSLAKTLAKNLGVRFIELPIQAGYETLKKELDACFKLTEFSLVHENLQARLRGLSLMAFSNNEHSLLLSTSNKSELATGYSTLYGDMCGGLAPIADLTKADVYKLSQAYNESVEIIPVEILKRAPTAELRANQKDQDSLPEYDLLDKSVVDIVEKCRVAKTKTDHWLLPVLLRTEFKRWQSAPILKISRHSFGRGRRYPIAYKFS